MNREEQFLKYLDGELSDREMMEVEQLLASDAESLQKMEEVGMNRQLIRTTLNRLNPSDVDRVLPFKGPEEINYPMKGLFRIAAAAIVLIGLTIAAWLILRPANKPLDNEVFTEVTKTEPHYDDLDFYISPNRCWNERKLSIIIEIK